MTKNQAKKVQQLKVETGRWYTYLNSDFKKGGWFPEEDLLLCEYHGKVYGNYSLISLLPCLHRTDNAMKNRFSTLCKKRAKHEALAKDNNTSYINPNNKRVIFPNGSSTAGISENATPLKKLRRTHISDLTENCPRGERFLEECATTRSQQLRPPFSVLQQNLHNVGDLPTQNHINTTKEISNDGNPPNSLISELKS
ncbi:transcription factor MYB124-like [Camellia sinensis]|uniref:transcription factor MYB124-like n=1 Tax=Camellia sinensis TaxID=4442 RepID=UPI0010357569|nr:transcription factor MYB124-like [Camellia sinensis]